MEPFGDRSLLEDLVSSGEACGSFITLGGKKATTFADARSP